ncbi:MAG: CBS domain-containing protein [Halieaceae bacterium]|nr:CBS domain-containing protein [Halieaceae bacterium]
MPRTAAVSECMHRSPITISENASIAQAVQVIVDNKLTGITVTNNDGTVVGVLSEIDCLKAILNSIYNDGDPDHRLVNEFMTTQLNTCTPTDSIVEVAQSMLETQQRRRPVLEDGKLVGQVSSGNVLWALMEYSRRKA